MNEQKPRRKEARNIEVSDGMIAAGANVFNLAKDMLSEIYRQMEACRSNEFYEEYRKPYRIEALIKFEEKIMYEPMSGCHIWTGAMAVKSGYGHCWNGEKSMMAHRFSYETHKGPIADGLVVDHKCRNRLCVNPDHLRAVTQMENVMCGQGAAATNARRTHCKHGHSLEDAYLKLDKHSNDGRLIRHCRICARVQSLAKYHRQKALRK